MRYECRGCGTKMEFDGSSASQCPYCYGKLIKISDSSAEASKPTEYRTIIISANFEKPARENVPNGQALTDRNSENRRAADDDAAAEIRITPPEGEAVEEPEYSDKGNYVSLDEYEELERRLAEAQKNTSHDNETVRLLLDNAFAALQRGDFSSGGVLLDSIEALAPEHPRLLLARLMLERKAKTPSELAEGNKPLSASELYVRLLATDEAGLVSQLKEYNEKIIKRIDLERVAGIYDRATSLMAKKTPKGYVEASKLLLEIPSYKDSLELAKKCEKLAIKQERREKRSKKPIVITLVSVLLCAALVFGVVFVWKSCGTAPDVEYIYFGEYPQTLKADGSGGYNYSVYYTTIGVVPALWIKM